MIQIYTTLPEYTADLKVFTDYTDTYVARDLDHVRKMHPEPECFDDAGRDYWRSLEPFETIKIYWNIEADPYPEGARVVPCDNAPYSEWGHLVICSAARWAEFTKPGLLCSTEY